MSASRAAGASAAGASAAANAPAANAPATPGFREKMMSSMKSMGVSGIAAIILVIVGFAFLSANLGYMAQLAGSSDSWDSVKTQMGGAAAMAFIGALAFMVALMLFFRAFNVDLPVYIVTAISCIAIAFSLTAVSVAAITR